MRTLETKDTGSNRQVYDHSLDNAPQRSPESSAPLPQHPTCHVLWQALAQLRIHLLAVESLSTRQKDYRLNFFFAYMVVEEKDIYENRVKLKRTQCGIALVVTQWHQQIKGPELSWLSVKYCG